MFLRDTSERRKIFHALLSFFFDGVEARSPDWARFPNMCLTLLPPVLPRSIEAAVFVFGGSFTGLEALMLRLPVLYALKQTIAIGLRRLISNRFHVASF